MTKESDYQTYLYESKNPLVNLCVDIRINSVIRELNKSDFVLDAGCGDGYSSSMIAPHVKSLVGIDLEKSKIKKAAKIAKKSNLSKKTRFLAKSIYDFRPKKRFDTVVCSDVIEHVDDPITLIRKLISFCKRGGRVVLTYPNILLTDLGRHIVYFGKNIEQISKKTDHTRPISRSLVKKWTGLAGGIIQKHRYLPNLLLPINELVIIKKRP